MALDDIILRILCKQRVIKVCPGLFTVSTHAVSAVADADARYITVRSAENFVSPDLRLLILTPFGIENMGRIFGGRRPSEMRDQLRVMVSNAIENPILANGRFAPRDGLAAIWTVETLEAFFQSYKLSFPRASIRKIRSNFLQTISILIYINWGGWARFNEMFFLYQGPETTRDRTDRRIRHYDIQTLTREDFLGPEAGGPFLDTRSIFCPIDIEEGSVSTWDDGWRLPFLAAKSERRGGGGFGKVTKEVIAARHYCAKSGITTTEVEVARKEFNSKIDFDRERLNLAKLAKCIAQHKHVVLPIATIIVGHQHNMLFPLAQMDLEKFLQGHFQPPEMCDMNDLLDEVTNLVDALDHLHNRLGVCIKGYHMDLKPANILVYPDSETTERPGVGKWKITDFGLSIITPAGGRGSVDGLLRDRVTDTMTHLQQMQGVYQAPEVRSGPGPSRRSDVWSFGCILVRVLAFKLDGIDGLRALDDLRRKEDDTIGCYGNDYFARGDPPVLNPHIENWINGLAHRSREDCPEEFLNDCVKLLLDILKIDKNARLFASEVKERLGSLKALLNVHQRPASPSESSSEEGSSGSSPPSTQPSTLYGTTLDLAFLTERLVQDIKNNDLSGIEKMLSLRMNIDRANENNETPLGVATEQGNEEVVQFLLNAGANVDARSAGGKTPLLIAVRKGHDRIAQILLDQRASCTAYSNEGFTCIHYATFPDTSVGLFRLLIAQPECTDIDILTQDGKHWTPLMMLIKHFVEDKDWERKFYALIEAEADVNRRDVNDISPLRCAVTEDSITAVKLLIENGAKREDFSTVPDKKHAMEAELEKAWPARRPSLASSLSSSSWRLRKGIRRFTLS